MNLTLPLTPAEEAKLLAKAREAGTTPEQVVRQANRLFDPEYPLRELPVDAAAAQQMASINRDEVPDMPDRIVAATGVRYGVPVISRDRKIRASKIQTIW